MNVTRPGLRPRIPCEEAKKTNKRGQLTTVLVYSILFFAYTFYRSGAWAVSGDFLCLEIACLCLGQTKTLTACLHFSRYFTTRHGLFHAHPNADAVWPTVKETHGESLVKYLGLKRRLASITFPLRGGVCGRPSLTLLLTSSALRRRATAFEKNWKCNRLPAPPPLRFAYFYFLLIMCWDLIFYTLGEVDRRAANSRK